MNGIYTNGPLQLAASGEFNQKVRQYENTVALGQGCTPASPCIFNANDYDYTVTGAYDFGTIMKSFGLRIGVVYEHTQLPGAEPRCVDQRPERATSGAFRGRFRSAAARRTCSGARRATARAAPRTARPSATSCTGNDTSTQQWELSYSYSLSPRTLLYTGFVKIANKAYNPTTFNINPYTIQTCEYGSSCNAGQPTGVVFGMVHFF